MDAEVLRTTEILVAGFLCVLVWHRGLGIGCRTSMRGPWLCGSLVWVSLALLSELCESFSFIHIYFYLSLSLIISTFSLLRSSAVSSGYAWNLSCECEMHYFRSELFSPSLQGSVASTIVKCSRIYLCCSCLSPVDIMPFSMASSITGISVSCHHGNRPVDISRPDGRTGSGLKVSGAIKKNSRASERSDVTKLDRR